MKIGPLIDVLKHSYHNIYIYNAMAQRICIVKGYHKYGAYLFVVVEHYVNKQKDEKSLLLQQNV